MTQKNTSVIKYSLKVWLTAVVVAPLLILLIFFILSYSSIIQYTEAIRSGLYMYLFCVVFELIFSSITWLIFTIVVGLVLSIRSSGIQKTWIIFVTAVLLTVGTCAAMLVPFGFLENSSDLSFAGIITGCNCSCIGLGVWFYKLKLPGPVSYRQKK